MRQLSIEQLETYDRQRAAAEKLRSLTEAQAIAAKQAELTNSQVQIRIAENQGDADLARARKQAEQTVVVAEAELARSRRQAEQTVVTAQADSQSRILAGRGESTRALQVGLAEATVLLRSITSFGDPRLYALAKVAEHLSKSTQPLVPDRVFTAGCTARRWPVNPAAACSARCSLCWSPKRAASPSPKMPEMSLTEGTGRQDDQPGPGNTRRKERQRRARR